MIDKKKLREWILNPPKKTVVETFYVDSYIDVEEFLEWWRRGEAIILYPNQACHHCGSKNGYWSDMYTWRCNDCNKPSVD